MTLRKPYKRDEVLDRLRRINVRAVFVESALSHLEAPRDQHIGIKMWGYIDSLNVPLLRL